MVPVIPNPRSIRAFPSASAFEHWLAANHSSVDELWLKIHKKASGLPTVTYAEALEVALCYGWIDGLKKSFDDKSFLQRFTPRRAKSIWSQVNTRHIERLTQAGRMMPAGHAQVDLSKKDGRWDNAYAAIKEMTTPDDLMAAIRAKPAALKTYETLNRINLFAMSFRVGNAKKPETRATRIADFVERLARGELLVPNAAAKSKPNTAKLSSASKIASKQTPPPKKTTTKTRN